MAKNPKRKFHVGKETMLRNKVQNKGVVVSKYQWLGFNVAFKHILDNDKTVRKKGKSIKILEIVAS